MSMYFTRICICSDLEENREVTKEEGETFAKKNGLMFMESSAKIGHNIQHAFLSIANNIYTDIHAGVLEVKKVSCIILLIVLLSYIQYAVYSL